MCLMKPFSSENACESKLYNNNNNNSFIDKENQYDANVSVIIIKDMVSKNIYTKK